MLAGLGNVGASNIAQNLTLERHRLFCSSNLILTAVQSLQSPYAYLSALHMETVGRNVGLVCVSCSLTGTLEVDAVPYCEITLSIIIVSQGMVM